MWVARNKNGSFSISDCKLVRGYVSGTCPIDNDGNPVENTWVCPDGSTPNIVWMNLIPNIKWEDEPLECNLIATKCMKVCPKCGRRIWYGNDDIHYNSCEQPSSGYVDEWEWIECPECKERIEV